MDRTPRLFAVWAGVALLLALHATAFRHVVDDAFISFRYLHNLLAGHGLVYNVGERVEGYTNFLWIALLAPFVALGIAPYHAAPPLGVACMAGAVALRWRLGRAGGERAGLFAAALLTASAPVAYWAAGGLETGLFCLLLVLLAWLVWRARWPASPLLAGGVGALLCMTRPDGVLYVGAAAAWYVLAGPVAWDRKRRWRAVGLLAAACVAVYAPYFLWRWTYYGALLPNTFYAKVGGGGAALIRGLGYLGAFIVFSGVGAVLFFGGAIVVGRTAPADRRTPVARSFTWLRFLFVGAAVAFPLLVGGDQLAMFRFAVPIVVLAVPAAVSGAAGRAQRARVPLGVAAAVATLLPTVFGPMRARVVNSERPADEARAAIGRWLRANTPADTLIAVVPAGILPYFADRPTLDLVGLNDRHIARAEVPAMGTGMPGHERYDADYVLERAPDLVFLGPCVLHDQPLPPAELERMVRRYAEFVPAVGALYDHPAFRRSYEPVVLPIGDRYAHAWARAGGNRG